ncbi:MAG: substrate-binding domain-containing protein [Planctomycetaceae bacterium]|nr:substrate-binding domain-containing protein [Planctomycetaceae bacterium]
MNKKTWGRMGVAVVVCMAVGIAAAGQKKDIKDVVLGLSVANLQMDFCNQIRIGAEAEAEKLGLELIVVDSRDDATTQIDQVQDLLARGIDALMFIPAGASAADAPVRDAHRAGIPVVTIDRNPQNEPGDVFIASDSYNGCKQLGEWVIEQTGGKGKVGVIQGQLGTTPEIDRQAGFNEAMAKAPGMIVIEQAADTWFQEDGFRVGQDLLQVNPDITVFFGRCDGLAVGAAHAARLANLRDQILVVGFDGDEPGLAAIRDGVIDATMTQAFRQFGREAIHSCLKLMDGEKLDPMRLVPVVFTTKDNVQQFLDERP